MSFQLSPKVPHFSDSLLHCLVKGFLLFVLHSARDAPLCSFLTCRQVALKRAPQSRRGFGCSGWAAEKPIGSSGRAHRTKSRLKLYVGIRDTDTCTLVRVSQAATASGMEHRHGLLPLCLPWVVLRLKINHYQDVTNIFSFWKAHLRCLISEVTILPGKILLNFIFTSSTDRALTESQFHSYKSLQV